MLKRIIKRFQLSLFPTAHDKELNRWFADNDDERFRYDYDLNSESLVLDLGGYKGQFASDIYARYNCRVLVFEPVKSFAEKIMKRFKRNPMIKVFCLALGSNSRNEVISLGADGTSIYRNSPEKETIQFMDVVEFFAEHEIHHVDLMKINIEGGEYELLPRMLKTGLINRVKHIQIQFHDIESDSETSMHEICEELSKTHTPTYQYKFVWENWRRRDV